MKTVLPERFQPELATLVKSPPVGSEWIYETKFDGYRLLARLDQGEVKLMTRNGHDWTEKLPELAQALAALPIESAWIDGELVALDEHGVSRFQRLQNALRETDKSQLIYYAFDLPFAQGKSRMQESLIQRKVRLKKLLSRSGSSFVQFSPHFEGSGSSLFHQACRRHLEGLIAKRKTSLYQSRRSPDWLKIKCAAEQEFVIGGFTPPAGARQYFGSLLLGYYDEGQHLRYVGRVGTGFNQQSLREIYSKMQGLLQQRPAFYRLPRIPEIKAARWVRPHLVAEVAFTEWTAEGRIRHPSFKGLREDKSPQEVHMETPSLAATLSHPEKVFFPSLGISKSDLVQYYHRHFDLIFPHVAGRPLSILRCPEGVAETCFYQKHRDSLPSTIAEVEVVEKNGKKALYMVVQEEADLMALIQHGALEFHTWGCKAEDLEHPDRLIFDLDPGPGTAWKNLLQCAEVLKTGLAELGLQSFVKTSGKKGLHVCLPLLPVHTWDEVKTFAHTMTSHMAHTFPDLYAEKMSKAERVGKIFIDYLRNERGATCVSAFSTRATPRAGISTPLAWHELKRLKSADFYYFKNIDRRLQKLNQDPWAGFFEIKQSLA